MPTPEASTSTSSAATTAAGHADPHPDGGGTAHPNSASAHLDERPVSPGKPRMRICVIDIGSNSVRLVIADCRATPAAERRAKASETADSKSSEPAATTAETKPREAERVRIKHRLTDVRYSVVAEEKATTRLASGLDSTGRLDLGAMEQSARAIAEMVKLAESFGIAPEQIRAVATCAVREADNSEEFLDLVRRWAGVKVKVISAKREAKLAFASARVAFDLARGLPREQATDQTPPTATGGAAVVDIGGGSTEVILTGARKKAGRIKRVFLLPIGAVRATERFGGPEVAGAERHAELMAFMRRMVTKRIWELGGKPRVLVGTGGTINSLGQMLLLAGIIEPGSDRPGIAARDRVQASAITFDQVESAMLHLRSLDPQTRQLVPGLGRERADLIIGGLAILLAVMERLGKPTLLVHLGGIRDGLIRRVAAKALDEQAGGDE